MTVASSTERVRGSGGTANVRVLKVSISWHTIFAVSLLFLIATPSFLFWAALFTHSRLHSVLAHISVFWFPLWAIFAVWVTMDASALYGFVGPRPDPFGPKALRLSALVFQTLPRCSFF